VRRAPQAPLDAGIRSRACISKHLATNVAPHCLPRFVGAFSECSVNKQKPLWTYRGAIQCHTSAAKTADHHFAALSVSMSDSWLWCMSPDLIATMLKMSTFLGVHTIYYN
jgi:hypothetical protein